MTSDDLCRASAGELRRRIESGSLTVTALIDATLDRIAERNPELHALRVVFADEAQAAAAAIDADPARRALPLGGIPIAIKDNVAVAGEVTAFGTVAIDRVAERDAPIVTRLRDAGAIIIGTAYCSELAVWPFTESPLGATRNPWNPDYSPGGSSGGSAAAVAAGMCSMALGSDGLGSIRAPASFCGLVGVKPEKGRVWTAPGDWNGLASNGPLTRTVADAARFVDAIDDTPEREPFAQAVETTPPPLRIALVTDAPARYPMAAHLGPAQAAALEATAEALRALGHTVDAHRIPFPPIASNSYVMRYLSGVATNLDAVDRPEAITPRTRRMATFGRVAARLDGWTKRASERFEATTIDTFERFDLVLTPGAVERPLRIGETDGRGAVRTLIAAGQRIPHFAPWNATGQPAMVIPAGLDELGLPVAVQLAGRHRDEATLFQVAAQLEAVRPWPATAP